MMVVVVPSWCHMTLRFIVLLSLLCLALPSMALADGSKQSDPLPAVNQKIGSPRLPWIIEKRHKETGRTLMFLGALAFVMGVSSVNSDNLGTAIVAGEELVVGGGLIILGANPSVPPRSTCLVLTEHGGPRLMFTIARW